MSDIRLKPSEQQQVVDLAVHLTGANPVGSMRAELLSSAIECCMRRCHIFNFPAYLERVHQDEEEFARFVSALTIHTTAFFREGPHFVHLAEYLQSRFGDSQKRTFTAWSAACSSGEEVYSIALVLEQFRSRHPHFDYHIYGSDIDPLSIATAQRAIFPQAALETIPELYRPGLMVGSGKTAGLFTLTPAIRQRCHFQVYDLQTRAGAPGGSFDVVFCRNVLIYFSAQKVEEAIEKCCGALRPGGMLALGHSEMINNNSHPVLARGNSIYIRVTSQVHERAPTVREVLVVDDSPTIRQLMLKLFEGTEFHGVAVADAQEASLYLKKRQVNLITLDLDMPGQFGIDWLMEQRRAGLRTPVVIVSDVHPSRAAGYLGALEDGAQEFIEKCTLLPERDEILDKFRGIVGTYEMPSEAARADRRAEFELARPDLIVIGASTGGPKALSSLLADFPKPAPPILVVQHLPASFAEAFPKHLAKRAGLKPICPKQGLPLEENGLYMAWGDYHVGMREIAGQMELLLSDDALRNGHRPSVDYLFESASRVKRRVLAILLTGMGKDGAQGMLKLRLTGATTFAEDHTSCVIYGMPREAIKLQAAQFIGSVSELRRQMELCLAAR